MSEMERQIAWIGEVDASTVTGFAVDFNDIDETSIFSMSFPQDMDGSGESEEIVLYSVQPEWLLEKLLFWGGMGSDPGPFPDQVVALVALVVPVALAVMAAATVGMEAATLLGGRIFGTH